MPAHVNTSWTLLCTLLALQVLAAGLLLLVTAPLGPAPVSRASGTTQPTVRFLPAARFHEDTGSLSIPPKRLLITLGKPRLADFVARNTSLCFDAGTEPAGALIAPGTDCLCRKGWHGPDCGQPEVVWRALARRRPPLPPPSRRTWPRRLVYVVEAGPSAELVEMAAVEASSVAELVVVRGEHTLRPRWCETWCFRTLQVPPGSDWTRLVADLHPDDLISGWKGSVGFVPNAAALLFLKLYDGLPTPVLFRAKWTVYGFFWTHPKHTLSSLGAWLLSDGKEGPTGRADTFVELGDLNHYGGWACTPCGTPPEIVSSLLLLGREYPQLPPHVDTRTVEDAVAAGVWLDSRTELLKARLGDREFAPPSALAGNHHYDLLLRNYYDRVGLDY